MKTTSRRRWATVALVAPAGLVVALAMASSSGASSEEQVAGRAPAALARGTTYGTLPMEGDPMDVYERAPDLLPIGGEGDKILGYARKTDLFPAEAVRSGDISSTVVDPYAPASPAEAAREGGSTRYLALYDTSLELIGYLDESSGKVLPPDQLPAPRGDGARIDLSEGGR